MLRFIPILLLILLASCSRKVSVNKSEVTRDSTYEKQLEKENRLLKDRVEFYENQKDDSTGTTVIFEPEPCDTVKKYLPGKITVDKSGVITAEGRIKSLTTANTSKEKELSRKDEYIDSLYTELQIERANVKTEIVEKVREVEVKAKRWWLPWLLLAIVTGLFLFKQRIPFIRNINV
jgi:hypothetical protein